MRFSVGTVLLLYRLGPLPEMVVTITCHRRSLNRPMCPWGCWSTWCRRNTLWATRHSQGKNYDAMGSPGVPPGWVYTCGSPVIATVQFGTANTAINAEPEKRWQFVQWQATIRRSSAWPEYA